MILYKNFNINNEKLSTTVLLIVGLGLGLEISFCVTLLVIILLLGFHYEPAKGEALLSLKDYLLSILFPVLTTILGIFQDNGTREINRKLDKISETLQSNIDALVQADEQEKQGK